MNEENIFKKLKRKYPELSKIRKSSTTKEQNLAKIEIMMSTIDFALYQKIIKSKGY